MSSKQSRSEANLNDLYARLDAVRMSSHEREHAKASLARAEAVAEAVFHAIDQAKRLLKILPVRPFGRPTKLAG